MVRKSRKGVAGKRAKSADPGRTTFELGLAMAGAISAGAYSAGVLDFLLQALDAWQKAKDAGAPGVPDHDVVIKVIAGASAGAITGALAAPALAGGLKYQRMAGSEPGKQRFLCVLPSLYEAWVVKPRMVAPDGRRDLLSLEDLRGKDAVVSALNSEPLEAIAREALAIPRPPAPARYPFLTADLHIYLTLTNLRGVPYRVRFSGGAYGMQSHGDRAHFVVKGLGTSRLQSRWASRDESVVLNAADLFSGGSAPGWDAFRTAALASGAFPVGLAPREIATSTAAYADRAVPVRLPLLKEEDRDSELKRLQPSWPDAWPANHPFVFLSVDGGLTNNEPFEYARYTLMENPPEPNERAGAHANRAVVMIDPFPEPPLFLPEGEPPPDLVSVLRTLFPTLKNQARFKPSELIDATDQEVYSRFLFAPDRTPPRRTGKGREKSEPFAIACGLLGGFGGFLDEAFRAHDFQLGRRNCQWFLRQWLVLPRENDVYQHALATDRASRAYRPTVGGRKPHICIIPLLGSARDEVPYPTWPRLKENDFEALQKRICRRVGAVLRGLIRAQTKKPLWRYVLWALSLYAQWRIAGFLRWLILSDLVLRDQIEGWALPKPHDSHDVRAILSELATPRFDLRTAAGIAESVNLEEDFVEETLTALADAEGRPFHVWSTERYAERFGGARAYTLRTRRPSPLREWWLVGAVLDWLLPPTID